MKPRARVPKYRAAAMRSQTSSDGVASTTTSTGAVCSRVRALGRAGMRSSGAIPTRRALRGAPDANFQPAAIADPRSHAHQSGADSCSDEERESGQRHPGVRPLVVQGERDDSAARALAASRMQSSSAGRTLVSPHRRLRL
jgi:hypothetical protein